MLRKLIPLMSKFEEKIIKKREVGLVIPESNRAWTR